jgi:hypothetical protein
MLGAIDHALAGVTAGYDRLNRAADRIAREGAGGDLAGNILDVMQAKHAVRANLASARAADETIGTLLDVLA